MTGRARFTRGGQEITSRSTLYCMGCGAHWQFSGRNSRAEHSVRGCKGEIAVCSWPDICPQAQLYRSMKTKGGD